MDIPTALKRLREELGVSQPRLAAKIGVTRSMLTKWETGRKKPTITSLGSLSNLCRINRLTELERVFTHAHRQILQDMDSEPLDEPGAIREESRDMDLLRENLTLLAFNIEKLYEVVRELANVVAGKSSVLAGDDHESNEHDHREEQE